MVTIIDGDSLIYFSLPKKDSNATYEDCLTELNSRIYDIFNKTNATKYIICLTDGKCFRYKNWKYSSKYKANRINSNKLNPIFWALKEYMKQTYNVYSCHELEADDLVSVYSYELSNLGIENTVASVDKDVLGQIPGIHFNYRKSEFIETKVDEVEYNTFKQVLVGDIVDGIYGIRGIGNKSADKLFSNRKDYYHVVLEEYIKKYGIYVGINKFYENYTLVYILKSFNEVKREVGLELEIPYLKEIEIGEKIW